LFSASQRPPVWVMIGVPNCGFGICAKDEPHNATKRAKHAHRMALISVLWLDTQSPRINWS